MKNSIFRWYLHYEGRVAESNGISSVPGTALGGKDFPSFPPAAVGHPLFLPLSPATRYPCFFSYSPRPLRNRIPAVLAPHSGRLAPQTRPLANAICTSVRVALFLRDSGPKSPCRWPSRSEIYNYVDKTMNPSPTNLYKENNTPSRIRWQNPCDTRNGGDILTTRKDG